VPVDMIELAVEGLIDDVKTRLRVI